MTEEHTHEYTHEMIGKPSNIHVNEPNMRGFLRNMLALRGFRPLLSKEGSGGISKFRMVPPPLQTRLQVGGLAGDRHHSSKSAILCHRWTLPLRHSDECI